MMRLCLQFGYGMMGHCCDLIRKWHGGLSILSPRDLTPEQLTRLGGDICKINHGSVLIDPQLYLPHSSHERLSSHDYWPKDYDSNVFWSGPQLATMLAALRDANRAAGAGKMILPSILASRIDDDWLEHQAATIREATAMDPGMETIVTLPLSAGVLQDDQQVGNLLDESEAWDASSFYIVCEHPNGRYLVDEPVWLGNVLDLIAGLRLRGAEVILGYSNHQMLIAGCAGVSTIASGTWMNVRAFPPEKFEASFDDEIKQRAIWCYCPQALSEYKVPFLDIAYKHGLISQMATPAGFGDGGCLPVFNGAQPSTVNLSERDAFRHYLNCLRFQAMDAVKPSFDATTDHHERMLNEAATLLSTLRGAGIMGQLRDFSDIVDVNRAALLLLKRGRGAMLRRKWRAITA